MRKDFNDNDIDRLMESLVCDSVDEDELREIADSPTVWWAVQREIAKVQEAKSPWPPARFARRWFMLLAPTALAAALVIGFFVWGASNPGAIEPERAGSETTTSEETDSQALNPTPEIDEMQVEPAAATFSKRRVVRARTRTLGATNRQTRVHPAVKSEEIKTEFIALNYAAKPKSGQIVRVKVPRSMMVQVGLVASVEKPRDLVEAEVLVGDDGLTRAIRFIH